MLSTSDVHGQSDDTALLAATSGTLNDALALSDEHGIVLAINAAYLKLYGLAEQEVVGHSFAVIFPEEKRSAAAVAYPQAFRSEAPAVYRASVRRSDGVARLVESRTAFVDCRARRAAMLSIIHDITACPNEPSAEAPLPAVLDIAALASLYDVHVRSALGYAHALLGDLNQAEHVVEDVLLAGWRAGISLERDASTAQLLLFSVLRRGVGEVLLARTHTHDDAEGRRELTRSMRRWWSLLAK